MGALVVFLVSITAIIAYFLVTVYKLEEQLEYELGKDNWASEASPTLGCSIEISRDIYMYIYIYVCLSYVKSRGIT